MNKDVSFTQEDVLALKDKVFELTKRVEAVERSQKRDISDQWKFISDHASEMKRLLG